jgi:hypothetical protein
MIITHTFDGVYWTAVLPGYDGPPAPCGSGLSEADAIDSLMAQLDDGEASN